LIFKRRLSGFQVILSKDRVINPDIPGHTIKASLVGITGDVK